MSHNLTSRSSLLVATALALAVSNAHAEGAYPTKPIYIVVPFPAGGYSDVLARVIATKMSADFGQGVVVENRPGAGGNIGADYVAKSRPDGYMLVMGTIGTQAINPLIYPHMSYDATKDFSPVAFVADAETVLVVNPEVPARTVPDLVKLAKQKPGDLTFASGGNGTTSQLAGELFKSVDGVAINHIPYKGNVPAISDVVAGHVAMSFATLQPAIPFLKQQKLIPLATLGSKRAALLPDVPTMAELGQPDLTVRNWTGLLAPAGTPKEVTTRLAAEVDKILQSADVHAQMESLGLTYVKMGPDEFGAFIQTEVQRWSKVVKQANITVN